MISVEEALIKWYKRGSFSHCLKKQTIFAQAHIVIYARACFPNCNGVPIFSFLESSVAKYSLELSSGGKRFGEQIEIDTAKGTETFHVPKTSLNESAGDIVYDFKRQVTMVRLLEEKACYMADSIDETLTPADLKEALEMQTPGAGEESTTSSTETQMTVVGELEDRSGLSAEMADLCVNLPIYSSLTKYSLELSSDGKRFGEQIEIDTAKGTETFHVPKTSLNESAGDIVYDFKRQVTMVRLLEEKACYMADSIDETLTPADLKEALEMQTPGAGEESTTSSTETQMTVVGELEDRSGLSAEMADLCVNLPIYVVTDGAMNLNDEEADEETDADDDREVDTEFYEDVDEDASNSREIIDLDDTPDTRKS
ncbi:unnamed protein product [Pocillopora meandrina]|uniref:BRICHOS domain-containing protein n=1 Tax=Pocillopora meandrina TaxID=46732 RepID=A0AAU9WY15_9CNID|nr:unnamed protein product [Pocillopora meandrina]